MRIFSVKSRNLCFIVYKISYDKYYVYVTVVKLEFLIEMTNLFKKISFFPQIFIQIYETIGL